ncbi:quinone oxidoreductase [Rhodobacteraceae bacterium RKSG542]|uniref:quinone oxidoreductase family protein n=1 Tax=Pseudovibrio flavus TaxID=2529854 RepID=UPI0012BCF0C9|nr:quinone oxidoreductase [Pseudovibrio flavus]MTI17544.1 quinone oxidoreductase [Pseudovibrio flavus]
MAFAIRVSQTGGPEVLKWEEVGEPVPGPGEVLVRHTAIGLNYIDTYFRSGLYPSPVGLPFSPGNEGAGIIEALGDDVEGFDVGDRVCYVGPIGAYAEKRVIPAVNLLKIPEGISDQVAAAMMLKGMTAQYLIRQIVNVDENTTLLYHAAAGGVGLILGQWAASLGATVIGTVGSDEKGNLARENGFQHVINYRTEDWVARVKEITEGRGCDVVYDGVGKDTYPGSLDCIRPMGMWVSFGQSSGALPPVDMGLLAQKGSLFATRPTLFTYIGTRERLETTANDLFEVVLRGDVKIHINQRYALKDAEQAHRDLEERKTVGTTLLLP